MTHHSDSDQHGRMLRAALGYAAAGLDVLPVEPHGKRPICQRGKDDATTDADTVTEWWTAWPSANIGVRPPRGIVVLDVDPRANGHVSLAALVAEHSALPETLTAETGGGGAHLWFAAPGPFRGSLGAGLDVKHHTGYVIAPPSVHPSGGRYRWARRCPTAPAPMWLRALLAPPVPTRTRTHRTASLAGLAVWVSRQRPGNRNNALHWAARRAVETGADPWPLVDAATRAGLDATEAERTVASACRAGGAA